MKLLIKIGVQNSCTPISLLVPPTLPVKGYTKTPSQKFQWTYCNGVKGIDDKNKLKISRKSDLECRLYFIWFLLGFTPFQLYFSYLTMAVHKSMFPGLFLTST